MIPVQVKIPNRSIKKIDEYIKKGYFENRSDALRTSFAYFDEKEKTKEFLNMLNKRSLESKDKKNLVPLSDL